jgi:hypothetical protein
VLVWYSSELSRGVPSIPITAVLSRTLHDALGTEAAADLVDWMEQVDTHRAELRDLSELNSARFGEFRHDMRAEFTALRMEMREGFAELKLAIANVELKGERRSADVESKMERRFADLLKWSFVFWCGTMALIYLRTSH